MCDICDLLKVLSEMAIQDNDIRDEILKQTTENTSTAPRDVAQALVEKDDDWRKLLPRIRFVAKTLFMEEKLVFVRKRKIVSPEGLKGVFRLAAPTYQEPKKQTVD